MPSIAALTRKEKKDLRILAWFTAVYCCDKHREEREKLSEWIPALPFLQRFSYCPECRDFLCYAIDRRLKCPLPDKPSCKHCHIHCYRRGHREKVREIMRYSGRALIKRGRLDLLWHYLL
jgi:hypothetical protein